MEVEAHEPGSWFLFSDERGDHFLSVVCGRVGEYLVEFALSEAVAGQVSQGGRAAATALARSVARDPEAYLARGPVKLAGTDAVTAALDRWRTRSGHEPPWPRETQG